MWAQNDKMMGNQNPRSPVSEMMSGKGEAWCEVLDSEDGHEELDLGAAGLRPNA